MNIENLRDLFKTSSWWGKILGGFFGFLCAKSVGALFGILIGNFFDQGLMRFFSSPHWHFLIEKREKTRQLFFEATFLIMGYIAKSDGRVTEQELQMAKHMMNEMRLSATEKQVAKTFFNQGKNMDFNIEVLLARLKNECHGHDELLMLFLDIQYRAAQVDGLTATKIQAVSRVFQALGFSALYQQYRFYDDFGRGQEHEQQQHQRHQSQNKQTTYSPPGDALSNAYALLNVPQNANKADVKKAYRRLISKHHPDKLIAQGLPEAMIKMANHKTQQITKAYELICSARNW